ncbi:hypothetical protein D3C80_2010430 [compost metagenome]
MGRRLDRFRCQMLHFLPAIHHDDFVADGFHHREIVADEDVGEVQLSLEFAEQVDDRGCDDRIKRRGNFIAND